MTDRSRVAIAIATCLAVLSPLSLRADVRADEKTHFQLAGVLGKVVNLFGGKAAREGTLTSQAVKGDRGARISEDSEQIVDLSEEKIYDVDLKKKSYKVTTFAELRRRMEEAQKKAQEDMRKAQEKAETKEKAAPPDQKEPQVEVDFDLKNTGQQKNINGFDTREEIMTITVREKGKTLEQSGGLVLTGDLWIAPKIDAMKEIQDFYLKFAQKLYGGTMLAGVQAEQMATIMAMYPMMKQAIGKMNMEGQRLQGTTILTTLTFDAVKSAEQVATEAKNAQQQNQDDKGKVPTSVGSLMGGLARRAAAKKAAGNEDDKDKDKTRATIMSSTTEVLKVATSVSPTELAIPAGFKETK